MGSEEGRKRIKRKGQEGGWGEGEGAEKRNTKEIVRKVICTKVDLHHRQSACVREQSAERLLVAQRLSNMRLYLRDGSAQTILRAATLR